MEARDSLSGCCFDHLRSRMPPSMLKGVGVHLHTREQRADCLALLSIMPGYDGR
jgi:hypothetical protein